MRAWRPLALGLTAAAALAACGNASETNTGGTATSPPVAGGSTGSTAPTPSASCAQLAHISGSVDDRGNAAASSATVAVAAGDSFFKPTCTTSLPEGTVAVTIHNGGTALHNFSVTDQSIDMDVSPGQTITVQVKVGSTPVAYFCKYHRVSGMQGGLVPAGG
jgi:plastocyanin